MIVEYGQTDLRQLDQLCQIARKKFCQIIPKVTILLSPVPPKIVS
jgi:hypothetical protein